MKQVRFDGWQFTVISIALTFEVRPYSPYKNLEEYQRPARSKYSLKVSEVDRWFRRHQSHANRMLRPIRVA